MSNFILLLLLFFQISLLIVYYKGEMDLLTISFVLLLGAKIGFVFLFLLSLVSYCLIKKNSFSLLMMGLSLISGLTGTCFIFIYGITRVLIYFGLS